MMPIRERSVSFPVQAPGPNPCGQQQSGIIMKLFTCQHCGQLLYFENTSCERCGRVLGFLPEYMNLSAMEADGVLWRALAAPDRRYRACANAAYDACNWQVEADATSIYCISCRHNRMVPDLSVPDNVAKWRKLEFAKNRLIYTILKLGLEHPTKAEDEGRGLAFDFLADPPTPTGDAPRVMTGHDNGLITIALAEADDAERERRRTSMGEPYRTLQGHLRHEVGHYYWDRLVADRGAFDEFRAMFGDERQDYGEALKVHYARNLADRWDDSYVSAYARAHPWEDFAETWAHYLHIVDTLETAAAFRIRVDPHAARAGDLSAEVDFDVYTVPGIEPIIEAWLPLAFAVNSLNRSMGHPDLYPFVLSAPVIEKLGYIHRLVRQGRTS
jgi:hypothetical protein